jgi:glyoxylase-like metal-dependent hydrolase (beta-lactamase superfamily II)
MQHWRSFYCNLSDENNAIVIAQRARNSIRMPLTQILDDVWYIGTEYVGQYILKNSQGLVKIDAGNNADEIRNYNLPAMRSLGLGAGVPLNGVLVTHGHGDHDGGALELKTATGAPIYLGSADASGKAYAPTTLDSSVLTPFDISVGGRTITVLSTPGHTVGAFGFIVRALDDGKEVKLFVSGGSSLVAENVPLVQSYLNSMERTYDLLKKMKVDTASNPHTYWDGSRNLIQQIQAEGRKKPSQFIIGNDRLLRAMAIGRTCTAAWLVKKDPTAVVPVWRVSSVEHMPASPAANQLSVRVTNGWGALSSQTVTFTNSAGAALCTATTDKDGVATCQPTGAALKVGTDKVIARFDGSSTTKVVDLGSESTALVEDPAVSGCRDLAAAKAASGSRLGDTTYSTRLDINGDGLINLRDLEAITKLIPAGAACKS